jgi:thiamine-monophosphate kinase
VTGALGGSAGGLRALRAHAAPSSATDALIARHMRPQPRVDAGRAALDAGLRCAIDISDGLVQDLGHVCEASNVDADLWLPRVPLDPLLAAAYPDDAARLAATGGEDYELILIGPDAAIAATETALGAPLAIVGRIREGRGRVRVLDAADREVTLPVTGWDHLAPKATDA